MPFFSHHSPQPSYAGGHSPQPSYSGGHSPQPSYGAPPAMMPTPSPGPGGFQPAPGQYQQSSGPGYYQPPGPSYNAPPPGPSYNAPPPPGRAYQNQSAPPPSAASSTPAKPSKGFERPDTVTFTIVSEAFDCSGHVSDDKGRVIYKLVDHSEFEKPKKGQTVPLEIFRGHDKSFVAKIYWGRAKTAQDATVEGLGNEEPVQILNGMMDTDLKWSLPDGGEFEWDGIWGSSFSLLDYRIPQPYSLSPATAAVWNPQGYGGAEHTTIEVHKQALSVPGFLDRIIVTVIGMEFSVALDNIAVQKAQNKQAIFEVIGALAGS